MGLFSWCFLRTLFTDKNTKIKDVFRKCHKVLPAINLTRYDLLLSQQPTIVGERRNPL
jgi:hypothetical protein